MSGYVNPLSLPLFPYSSPGSSVPPSQTSHISKENKLPVQTGEEIKDKTCTICSKQFSTKTNMKRHIAAIHTKERPFKCKLCDKSFVLKHRLNLHYMFVHENKDK